MILAKLPQLDAIINESMRLMPPGPTQGWRDTGPERISIDDIYIPPHVTVVSPCYTVSRLPSAFEKPNDFLPDRWHKQPELIKDRRAFTPFSIGAHSCPAKNMALLQVQLVLSTIMVRYRVGLAPGETGAVLWRDMKDQIAAFPGELRVQFVPR